MVGRVHGWRGPGGRRGPGRGGWQQADLPPCDDAAAWLHGRLPDGWFTDAPEVTIDREEIVVVGGGNSAGQAAVFLAQTCRRVHMLVRGETLAQTMSRYLIRRIEDSPTITLHTRTEVVALEGNGHLAAVHWSSGGSGTPERHDIRHVFMMRARWRSRAERETRNQKSRTTSAKISANSIAVIQRMICASACSKAGAECKPGLTLDVR